MTTRIHYEPKQIEIRLADATLHGDLGFPDHPRGLVLFAHDTASDRHSPRNQIVADHLQADHFATLLFNLLTEAEENEDAWTGHFAENINLLANRLMNVTHWVRHQRDLADLGIGYFGGATGGAAALVAAVQQPDIVRAVVLRGGRPELADDALPLVPSPTLLLVGSENPALLDLNRQAMNLIPGETQIKIIEGATDLFQEPIVLEQVAALASAWFERWLPDQSLTDSH